LKDKQFRVAEVYSFAEWVIRKGLKQTGQFLLDQKGRPTQRPTLKWICFLFYGVAEVTVEIGKECHREIANLTDSLMIVIRILGKECEKYYGMEE